VGSSVVAVGVIQEFEIFKKELSITESKHENCITIN
jgi:hypothetical protein